MELRDQVADDDRLRVCLERTVELEGLQLRVRDWPGRRGPVIHVPDPTVRLGSSVVDTLAAMLPPRYRVLSLQPRDLGTYQLDAADLLAMLDTLGFRAPVFVGERLGCVAALVVAAWYPGRVAGLVLVDPLYAAPPADAVRGHATNDAGPLADDVRSLALVDCPPDWARLRARILCPVLETSSALVATETRLFLDRVCG
jgi:pimeloyl-ACP methyl ester carboxylesterase